MDDRQAQEYARRMVEHQLRGHATRNEAVLAAMLAVPRHLFVPHLTLEDAYADKAMAIAEGQTISQPFMVALMTDLLEVAKPVGPGLPGQSALASRDREGAVTPEDHPAHENAINPVIRWSSQFPPSGLHVLEVGTGSGYQAAVLAQLGAQVVSIERSAVLAEAARERLDRLGYGQRVQIVVGDGTLGWPQDESSRFKVEGSKFSGEGTPHGVTTNLYDRIIVTAGAPDVPKAYRAQLRDGGRIVIPVGDRDQQTLLVLERHGDQWSQQRSVGCRFVPLVGADGWPQ
jgi:protein-L-isoaspartate(D-aspartate) O-methyltransferase